MVPLKDGVFIDTSLITHTEYQLFLDEQVAKGGYRQPDHWNKLSHPDGQGAAPVLGVRYSDAQQFCEWLTARSGGIWQFRLPGSKDQANHIAGQFGKAGYWFNDGSVYLDPENRREIEDLSKHACARALDLVRSIVLDIALDLARIRSLDLDLAHVRSRVRDLIITSATVLLSILDEIRKLPISMGKNGAQEGDLHLLRRALGFLSYFLASVFYHFAMEERKKYTPKKRPWLWQKPRSQGRHDALERVGMG